MYWIMLFISAGFLVLLFLARKQDTAPDTPSLLKPFYKAAMYLYKKICSRVTGIFASVQVEKDLLRLHPGEAGECVKTEYYVKKMAIFLAIIVLGSLFGAAARFSAQGAVILGEDGSLVRGNYREGARKIDLKAEYGQQQMHFQVNVEPILLTGEEADTLFTDFLDKLPACILGENESLDKVVCDLTLAKNYEDFPIDVQWESSKPGTLSSTGRLYTVEEKEEVTLELQLSYGEYKMTEEIKVTVLPPEISEEEQLYQEMEELLRRSQEESMEQETWKLPAEWRGEGIRWSQSVEDNSILLWIVSVVTAFMVFMLSDKDLHQQIEKRKKSLKKEYPGMVHKLALFVGAGMTIRGAFQKLAGDYEADCRDGGSQISAYEEVLYTCRELRSGVSEGASYEHFGKRTELQEYIRLSTLLAQNLKKGNSTLLERLREEADKAAEERLQQSKKLGEEAGTKLLVPMVLMLAVVMAMIMIPALSNM
ncbi:MAG: secretion protein F [Lachnospiraceae bacterium]|nr:secretion protein F [Lachnospiraceae bacterium]